MRLKTGGNKMDKFYALCERYGGKISNWAWTKRWCNRETGTGYKK